MGISNRGTKAKTITSCDNAFVTNIVLARDPGAKRMFSVRKRSVSGKAHSRNVNQPHVMVMSHIISYSALFTTSNYCYIYYNGKGNRDVLNKV
ncbi:hypothetical protein ACPCXF_07045 [Lysinibacillus agricola]